MAQYAEALRDGEFPVKWANNFSNYGHPLPIFAHQIPIYLGALLEVVINQPVSAYNWVMLLGAATSTLLFYCLLKKFVAAHLALIGALIFNFAPYRIINIYIRGALPEIFASLFLPLILLGIVGWFRDNNKEYALLTGIGIAGLALSHPMLLFVSSILFLPFAIYYNRPVKKHWQQLAQFVVISLLGLGIAAYYLLPLLLESKYFYQSLSDSMFVQDSFLQLENYVTETWFYFLGHPGPRGDFIIFGLVEAVILGWGIMYALIEFIKTKQIKVIQLLAGSALVLILLTLPVSGWLYEHLFFLSGLQYSWRMFSSLIFITPWLMVLVIEQYFKNKNFGLLIGFAFMLLVLVNRMPQLYSKNSTQYDSSNYYFTRSNLHSQNLNTIWSGNSEDYPVKTKQYDIIEGEGSIEPILLKNATRKYQIKSSEEIRLIDYTFYYPGWKVLADGEDIPIEFQDTNYRGLITYQLPPGEHLVKVVYTDTKIRQAGYLISGLSVAAFLGLAFLVKKNKFWLGLKNRLLPLMP